MHAVLGTFASTPGQPGGNPAAASEGFLVYVLVG
jgi:hypothetical protein